MILPRISILLNSRCFVFEAICALVRFEAFSDDIATLDEDIQAADLAANGRGPGSDAACDCDMSVKDRLGRVKFMKVWQAMEIHVLLGI